MPARKEPLETQQEPVPEPPGTDLDVGQFSCMVRYAWGKRTLVFEMKGRIEEIERHCIALERRGYSPCISSDNPFNTAAKTPAAPAEKPRVVSGNNETVAPWYNQDGEACCPVHHRVLKEGRYGLFCSAIGRHGDAVNAKGYCALKFTDEDY